MKFSALRLDKLYDSTVGRKSLKEAGNKTIKSGF